MFNDKNVGLHLLFLPLVKAFKLISARLESRHTVSKVYERFLV